jgi:hypothetical protein
MYSRNEMWRDLAPSLAAAAAIDAAGGAAYGLGAPLWVFYLAIVVSMLAVLPAYERWDRQHHP